MLLINSFRHCIVLCIIPMVFCCFLTKLCNSKTLARRVICLYFLLWLLVQHKRCKYKLPLSLTFQVLSLQSCIIWARVAIYLVLVTDYLFSEANFKLQILLLLVKITSKVDHFWNLNFGYHILRLQGRMCLKVFIFCCSWYYVVVVLFRNKEWSLRLNYLTSKNICLLGKILLKNSYLCVNIELYFSAELLKLTT